MSKIFGRDHKLGKIYIKRPGMYSSIILSDESTSICPKTQPFNIKGIYTSVTTDILLSTTTAGLPEEVSKCTEN